MRAGGFEPEDYADDDFEVWPENWPAFQLFCRVRTQWRVGMGGATGLDYNVLFRLLDKADSDDWFDLFEDVRVLEAAALEVMSQKT